MGQPIDGRAHAATLREELRATIESDLVDKGTAPPSLVSVLVDPDDASEVYLKQKRGAAKKVGIELREDRLEGSIGQEGLQQHLAQLRDDAAVDGVIIEMPLPDDYDRDAALMALGPAKDMDGLHPHHLGQLMRGAPWNVPATAAAVLELLDREQVPLEGEDAVVIGRSPVVGKPAALLLLARHATVSIAHSRTANLEAELSSASVVVAATGVAHLVTGEMLAPGSVVIDVGMNRLDGKLVGDVHYEQALAICSKVTPVPGGVGPMTVACLLRSAVQAALRRAG